MKKKVILDFQNIKNLHNGLGQFSLYLGQAITKHNNKYDLTYLLPKNKKNLYENVKYEVTNKWKKDSFYKYIKFMFPTKKYDLWHMTSQQTKFMPFSSKVPTILTIHDLNYMRDRSNKRAIRKMKKIQKMANRASIITTISHFVADELKEHLDLKGKEVIVIYNGLNKSDAKAIKPTCKQINKPYLFTIGQVLPKKNFHVLIDLIKNTSYNLVISGQDNSEYAKSIKEQIKKLHLEDRVILNGPINEGEKKWLYQNCEAFVFPSITEGFGLPVIEAMQYGKPVFASNSTSLPEIGGEFCFYWDNYDTKYMKEVLEDGLNKYKNNPLLKDKIIQHSEKFSWDDTAKEYLKLYDKMILV
jgi:glycosyltransferase involved in cell wall biosynthesis